MGPNSVKNFVCWFWLIYIVFIYFVYLFNRRGLIWIWISARPLAVGDSEVAEEAQIQGRHIEVVSAELSRHICRMVNSCMLCRDNMNHHGRENPQLLYKYLSVSRSMWGNCVYITYRRMSVVVLAKLSHSVSSIWKCVSSTNPTVVTSRCTLKYTALYPRS
jgi:hypothetical protein